ncbi:MAG TPA: hypothetical protein DEB31_06320 [Clostridiales bacterium]|nr:hypothetical protein [Clostridiales bacterium]
MLYIESDSMDAAFHFSAEEYIMRQFPSDEPVMMIWQTAPCAMLGANQIAEAEIDMARAKQEGVQIVRRASGGGTIFTDPGTFLITIILPYYEGQDLRQTAAEGLAGPIVSALEKMGIPAKIEGRNDILVSGKKVSGFAQYVRHGKICSHGSLLYDADLEMLARILRVDDEKIRSKALRSVRSRVTNIMEYMAEPRPARAFLTLFKEHLFSARPFTGYTFNEQDFTEIGRIYHEKYGNPAWIIQRSPSFSFHNSVRFAGGKVEVYLAIASGKVTSCSVRGDFLGAAPIRELEERLENILFQRQAFADALTGFPLPLYLGNILIDELLSCIFY